MATQTILAAFFFLFFNFNGVSAVDSLRFFVIGDMGGVDFWPYETPFERCTAKEMGHLADTYSPKFILELGDNFYFEGVKNVEDERFKLTFEDVYTADSLQVPWYLIAGNHDHVGNVTAQIEYSKVSKRWNFPSYYYYKEFPISNSKETVGIVFIDTILLCGNSDDNVFEQLGGPTDLQKAKDQWTFIETSLNNSKATYLFVAGHYPVYSIAEHGPTKCLEDKLQPMLDKYNANGYMSGHEHNLQHLQVKSSKGSNLDYYVSGMANFINKDTNHKADVPRNSSKFHYASLLSLGGFLYVEATPLNMTFTFIDANGARLYTNYARPRKL